MDHMKMHVASEHNKDDNTDLCRYCLKMFPNASALDEHLISSHPLQTREGRNGFKCVICAVKKNIILIVHGFVFAILKKLIAKNVQYCV